MNSDPKLGLCWVSRASACLLFLSVRFARSVANLAYFDETNCLFVFEHLKKDSFCENSNLGVQRFTFHCLF